MMQCIQIPTSHSGRIDGGGDGSTVENRVLIGCHAMEMERKGTIRNKSARFGKIGRGESTGQAGVPGPRVGTGGRM